MHRQDGELPRAKDGLSTSLRRPPLNRPALSLLAIVFLGCTREPSVPSRRENPSKERGDSWVTQAQSRDRVQPLVLLPALRETCDSAAAMVHEALGLVIRRQDGDYFDSFQGIRRQGCRLTAEGSFADLGEAGGPVTIVETAFRRHGWRGDLRYMADGPDGSDVGLRRLDRLCLVLGRWDGGDDGEDTTSASSAEPQARFQTILECARDVASNRDAGVPDSIWNLASRAGLDSIYAISLTLQYPPYLEGDFDGDGANDAAVLVEHRLTGKLGIAVLRRHADRITILSAGAPGAGPVDLSWIDSWDVYRKGSTYNLTTQDRPAIQLGADALWVGRRDSVSAFYVWTGSDYVWESHRK